MTLQVILGVVAGAAIGYIGAGVWGAFAGAALMLAWPAVNKRGDLL